MVFSSISFIFYFLPVVLIAYFIVPKRFRNIVLLVGSIVFYAFGEPIYVLLLIFSSLVDYAHGLIIEKNRGTKKAKAALISSIVINVSLLAFFKYADFMIVNLNNWFDFGLKTLDLRLPIGISFYTFQTMSYTIDVYRGKASVQRNLFKLSTYVTLFPQLIAGPIVRYKDIQDQLDDTTVSYDNFAYGIKRFITGLAKKVLIVNSLGQLSAIASSANEPSVLFYWIGAIAFALQIYFDFSGYSDMAIGLGRMFNFRFLENFNYPYIAKSITDFWRRWHISLGTWFREYVYYPLGGNRRGMPIWLGNILVVWFLTGFWHGAAWNFIIWGLFFGFIIVIEKLFLKRVLDKTPAVINHIYVVFTVVISFVIFKNESLVDIVLNLKGMFGVLDIPFTSPESLYYLKSNA
ncbi:MAG: MBOAT family O-acyltransferase, partial [Clostridia bacterium]|nr:MBOAT family O-acyltransferase [Clostridia bacterium]